jgi:hypothetical protein
VTLTRITDGVAHFSDGHLIELPTVISVHPVGPDYGLSVRRSPSERRGLLFRVGMSVGDFLGRLNHLMEWRVGDGR